MLSINPNVLLHFIPDYSASLSYLAQDALDINTEFHALQIVAEISARYLKPE